jgi:hypothetical protein
MHAFTHTHTHAHTHTNTGVDGGVLEPCVVHSAFSRDGKALVTVEVRPDAGACVRSKGENGATLGLLLHRKCWLVCV